MAFRVRLPRRMVLARARVINCVMSRQPTVPPGVHHLAREDGDRLAVMASPGKAPGVLFLCDLGASMEGALAQVVAAHAAARGHAVTRFDYFGHGRSDGHRERGTSDVLHDNAIVVLEEETSGPQILVGEVFGAWLALQLTQERPDRIAGLLLVAPAMHADTLLGAHEFDVRVPVRIIQGRRGHAVTLESTLDLVERIASEDVTVSLIKGGGPKLDRPGDMAAICAALDGLIETAVVRQAGSTR